MARLKRVSIPVVTTGSAGSATGSEDVAIPGGYARLHAVEVDYNGAPATTDVTITANGRSVLTLTDVNTDKTYYPRTAVQTTAGADIASRGEEPILCIGSLLVAVAGSNALSPAVTVHAFFEL